MADRDRCVPLFPITRLDRALLRLRRAVDGRNVDGGRRHKVGPARSGSAGAVAHRKGCFHEHHAR